MDFFTLFEGVIRGDVECVETSRVRSAAESSTAVELIADSDVT